MNMTSVVNFIKNILPKTFTGIAYVFDLLSKTNILISMSLHKLFKTPLGQKLIVFEAQMKIVQDMTKKMEDEVKKKDIMNSRKTIIPMSADPKIVNILSGKGKKNDEN